MDRDIRASNLAIFFNSFLFIIKVIVGLLYNSISLISDALNSFTDIITSLIIKISIKVSYKEPDKDHQFGHTRAQPIGGLIAAILISIVGYEVIVNSINRIIESNYATPGFFPLIIVIIVFIVKTYLYIYTKKSVEKSKSVALKAAMIDHRNDLLISFGVFIGLIFVNMGIGIFDPIMAIIIGIYIIFVGFQTGKENIDYLMGKAPNEKLFNKVESISESVEGVLGLNDVKGHMLGTKADMEVHIYVDKNLNVKTAHDIGEEVRKKLEKLPEIHKATIHIDPFLGTYKKKRAF